MEIRGVSFGGREKVKRSQSNVISTTILADILAHGDKERKRNEEREE